MKLEIGKLIDERYIIYLQYADEIAVGRHLSPTADDQYAIIYTDVLSDDGIRIDSIHRTQEQAENAFKKLLWGDDND